VDAGDIIVGLVVAAGVSFDFTNGFHDTANAMATTIATGALPPRVAVSIAAVLNFVGAFISLSVAATIAEGIVESAAVTPVIILGGLIGAISWNLATWWFGIPSSSSHALIGGVVGATLVGAGSGAIEIEGIISKVIIPAAISPILAGLLAAIGVAIIYLLIRAFKEEKAEREFRWLQVASSSMVALAHGNFTVPTWVVVICATAIAAGTYSGGWRIIKTLGTKVVEVRPPQGFGSEAIAATVILASSHVGYPLSTTQVVSGAVTGAGVGRPGAQVNWKVIRNIVAGWCLTLPAAAATSALVFAIIELLGGGAFGAIVAVVILAIGCFLLWQANRRQPSDPEDSISDNPVFGPEAKKRAEEQPVAA
jgi:PiT family inorganic phosphate transporter